MRSGIEKIMEKICEEDFWVFTEDGEVLLAQLEDELRLAGYKKLRRGSEYLYVTGAVPVMLVAHGDIIHDKPPLKEEIFCDTRKGILWSPSGLGADDRAGVLGILELVRRGFRPHVLITLGEESGCTGARQFIEEVDDTGVTCVIELDRKNSGEAVFYDCNNKEFKEYILNYGFSEANGTFTDITTICPAWGVAGVNISCGYHGAHTTAEYLVIPSLWETLDKIAKILTNPPKKRFKYGKAARLSRGISWRDIAYCDKYRSRYSYPDGLRSDVVWRRHDYFDLTVYVDIADLIGTYGGTRETWEEILETMQYDLLIVAENAVYEEIGAYAMCFPTELAEEKA